MSSKDKKDKKEKKRRKELRIIGTVKYKAFLLPRGIYNQVREVIHKPLKTEQEIKTEKQVKNNRSHSPGRPTNNQHIYYTEQRPTGLKEGHRTLKPGPWRKFSGRGGTQPGLK